MFELISRIDDPLPSLFRVDGPTRPLLRVGAVQCAWDPDPVAHLVKLRAGVELAAKHGAEVVLLQELTLSPYFCRDADIPDALARYGEDLEDVC